MFYIDNWLSEQIGKSVYQLKTHEFSKDNFSNAWENFKAEHKNENYFVFSKVNIHFVSLVKILEETDFKLIETNLKYELENLSLLESKKNSEIKVSFAEKKHQKAVELIANENFSFSRFHLDLKIDNNIANQIKKNWVKNFFSGHRGDEMIVAIMDDEPIGFLQLIVKEKELLIDLIGVAKRAQGRGVACSMIEFACKNIRRSNILVGTQIGNIPANKLYQKLGFQLTESNYVFHYHS